MLPDLANILQACALNAIASEVLFLHGPSALQEYALGRVKIPDPSAEALVTRRDEHPNALQVYPELSLAIQPVNGIIFPGVSAAREEWGGYFNTDRIHRACDEVAENKAIKTLVLVMDTPGGAARGLHPASQALLELPKRRHGLECLTYVPRLCASAGYYLAASTQGIHASPSALVGSIGTIASLTDSTGFWKKIGMENILFTDGALKSLGHARFGVTKEHKEYMQREVDQVSAEFKGLVRERRKGIKDADMQGQVFEARRAPAALIDTTQFRTLEEFIANGTRI